MDPEIIKYKLHMKNIWTHMKYEKHTAVWTHMKNTWNINRSNKSKYNTFTYDTQEALYTKHKYKD